MITETYQVKKNKSRPSSKTKKTKTNQSTVADNKKLIQPSKSLQQSTQINNTKRHLKFVRSPFFSPEWSRFIPSNWIVKKSNFNTFQQLLISRSQFENPSDFKHGIKLSAYMDTQRTLGLDSFAQALELYHQIRHNNAFELLDSQFKVHPTYKVFNIKYQNQDKYLLLTEFYIDEKHNDLFALTIQAATSDWQHLQEMAKKIVSKL